MLSRPRLDGGHHRRRQAVLRHEVRPPAPSPLHRKQGQAAVSAGAHGDGHKFARHHNQTGARQKQPGPRPCGRGARVHGGCGDMAGVGLQGPARDGGGHNRRLRRARDDSRADSLRRAAQARKKGGRRPRHGQAPPYAIADNRGRVARARRRGRRRGL